MCNIKFYKNSRKNKNIIFSFSSKIKKIPKSPDKKHNVTVFFVHKMLYDKFEIIQYH